MLILSHTIQAYMRRDTVIYLLQNLGFIINVKKSILHPCQKIEFLGMEIDSIKMTLSLTPEKVQKVVKTCQNLLRSHSTTLLELTRVVGLLSSTIQAVEPAKIQLRFLQQQQIVCLRKKMNYQSVITLNTKSRTELTWWIENLRFCNGRTFSQLNPQVIIQTDASLTGWGAVCNGVQTSGQLTEEERSLHINVLELLAIKLALFSFTRGKRMKAIHFQIDNKAAFSYLWKMGGTKNEYMIRLSKEIWHYVLNHNMAITAEYLPSVLNTVADRQSRKKTDSSEWLLHPKVFQAVSQLLGSPPIYLFASRLCHQLPQYIAWHPDPCSQGTDAMIQNWNIGLPYAFPIFNMISIVLLKMKQECVSLLILTAPVWSTQPWYP